jgi:hypothetical protein
MQRLEEFLRTASVVAWERFAPGKKLKARRRTRAPLGMPEEMGEEEIL